MDDPLWTPQQAADFLNFSPRSLERRRRTGDSPPWVSLSRTCVRYRPSDVQKWVEDHLQDTVRDEQPMEASR